MLKYLIEKEFKQLLRDPFIPKLIIIFPVLIMLILPWAATMDVKRIKICVVDNDHSSYSRRLIQKITASEYFQLEETANTYAEGIISIEKNHADVVFEIKSGFESDLIREGTANVFIAANAVNGIKGGLGATYLSGIILDFSNNLRMEQGNMQGTASISQIDLRSQYFYNPHLEYRYFMIPALMVILLTLLCGFLPALNIVKEKENGTIEQINVTPVSKLMFILGKLIPHWIIGFMALSIAFIISALVYGLNPAGSLLTLYMGAMLFVLVLSGVGIVVSNYSDTMQQAMFVIFFFILILILISGLFTPISSMPNWGQWLAAINPLTYFIRIMRLVFLKGSGIIELYKPMLTLFGFAVFFNLWAIYSYRKAN